MGVDWFFVISGFIMAWICVISKEEKENPIEFLIKRIFRVAPPYWLATVLAMYLLSGGHSTETVLKSFLFIPLNGNDPPFYGYSALNIGWSLNYEILFYAIVFFSLFLKRNYVILAACSAIVLATLVAPALLATSGSIISTQRQIGLENKHLLLLTNSIMLEFVLGMLSAVIFSKIKNASLSKETIGILAITSLVFFIHPIATYDKNSHSPLSLGLPAALLIISLTLAECRNIIKIPKILVWLGERSFSIYLVHLLVVIPTLRHLPQPSQPVEFYGQLIFIITLTLIVANIWFLYVEKYFHSLGINIAQRIKMRSERCI